MSTLRDSLILHEAIRLKVYLCPAGKWSVGFGRNLEDKGISEAEAHYLLDNDIADVLRSAKNSFPWFTGLSLARQDIVAEMIFNLGLTGFKEFKRLIAAIEKSDWERAAQEAMASKWAGQVGRRAVTLSEKMRTG